MKTIEFKDWPIWFCLHVEEGAITGMEEHDPREGGGLCLPEGKTWSTFFLERVSARYTCPTVLDAARELLVSLGIKENISETTRNRK